MGEERNSEKEEKGKVRSAERRDEVRWKREREILRGRKIRREEKRRGM